MAERRDILWRFLGDAKSLNRASRDAEGSLGKVDKKMGAAGRSADLLSQGFAAVGGTYAVSRLADFANDAADLAEQAQIAADSADRALGPAAENLRDRFDDLRGVMGYSSGEFDQLIAKQGLMVTGLGVDSDTAGQIIGDLINIGGDLAAFSGQVKDTSGAIDAVSAAIRGEFDPLEQWGVKLSEAQVKAEIAKRKGADPLFASLSDGEQRLITINDLITKKAGPAIGSLGSAAETAGGKANDAEAKMKDLQKEIGKKLLPVVMEARENTLLFAESLLTLTDNSESAGRKVEASVGLWDSTVGQFLFTSEELKEEFRMWGEALGIVEEASRDMAVAAEHAALASAEITHTMAAEQGIIGNYESSLRDAAAEAWNLENANRQAAEASDAASEAWGRWVQKVNSSKFDRDKLDAGRDATRFVQGADQRQEFASGGIVPGMPGTKTSIIAHAGERVIPLGGGGGGGGDIYINIGVAGDPYQTAQTIADLLTRYEMANGTRISGVST